MKIKEQMENIKDIEVPFHVWSAFGDQCKVVTFAGQEACLGEDYKTLEQLRAAIDWYADQLGGTVKWSKK